MKQIVGVAELKVSAKKSDTLVTYALGSCLGVTLYDPQAYVGGLLHVMLPTSKIDKIKAEDNPAMFVDTGVPKLFTDCYQAGADRSRLVIKVVGGAAFRGDKQDFFAIGKRNYGMLRKLLWKNGFMLAAEDVGGSLSRTLFLDIKTGRTWVRSNGREWDIC